MTTNAIDINARQRRPSPVPRLPPIARDPLDDAREILAAFSRKQGAELDVPYADLAEDLAAALRTVLAMLARPRRRELPVWKRLPVEQARQYIDNLAALPRDSETDCARQLGRLEVHAARLLDVIDSETAPW
jgi:hypothetical protein